MGVPDAFLKYSSQSFPDGSNCRKNQHGNRFIKNIYEMEMKKQVQCITNMIDDYSQVYDAEHHHNKKNLYSKCLSISSPFRNKCVCHIYAIPIDCNLLRNFRNESSHRMK